MTYNLYSAERAHTRNKLQMETLETMLREHLDGVLRKGWYGTAGISVTIHDGVIQNVRQQTERTRRCDEVTGGE